jgi:hypothetical protein
MAKLLYISVLSPLEHALATDLQKMEFCHTPM